MRALKSILLLSLLMIVAGGCFQEPTYPDTPEITFNDIVFKVTPPVGVPDTLVLYVDFKDGDGDLGLSEQGDEDSSDPYNSSFYFQAAGNGELDTIATRQVGEYTLLLPSSNTHPLVTNHTRTQPGYSALPSYTCAYYTDAPIVVPKAQAAIITHPEYITDSLHDQNGKVYYLLADTLLVLPNDNHYNMTVEFLVKNADQSYTEFNWRKEYCTTFDGRFPDLSDGGNGPLEGTIRYNMISTGFLPVFSIKTLKLRIYIKDRALHKSNVIETPDFTLDRIKK